MISDPPGPPAAGARAQEPARSGQSGVYPAVDLGEHGVEDKIVELLLAADVAVLQATKGRGWRPGQHHDASGTAAAEAVQTAH